MKKSFGQIVALTLTIAYLITAIVLAVLNFQWISDTISRIWQDGLDDGQHHLTNINKPIYFVILGVFVVSSIAAILIHKKKPQYKGSLYEVMLIFVAVLFFPAGYITLELCSAYIIPVLEMVLGMVITLTIFAIPPIIGFAIYKR